ncbi:MAG: glycosyltransferase family 2 protein [Actinomycetota bacterium]|nr:glycosyltransferase family 2 protein [Actinomycetota bacterium]
MKPRVSIVVPVYQEGKAILGFLERLFAAVTLPSEVLAVYDFPEDATRPYLEQYAEHEQRLVPVHNTRHPGPAWALRCGIERARADVVVVTMADGSDDPRQIDDLVRLVEEGAVIAAASRYMPGGRQIGAPAVKQGLSRTAGLSLYALARVGTRDATNSFKAYSKDFLTRAGIESETGFEMGIELVAKARRLRLRVEEVPTTWVERSEGRSNFKLLTWLPSYLRWYFFAFGPPLRERELRGKAAG